MAAASSRNRAKRACAAPILLVMLVAACGEEEHAPPYDPLRETRSDAGHQAREDAGGGDAGLMLGDDVLGGMTRPEPPDDFISNWATLDDPHQICAGWGHSCGIRHDGTAVCWGQSESGQLDVPRDETFVSIACGDRGACAITDDGRLRCWGANNYGQTDAPTEGEFTEVACGELHCCAIDVEDRVSCWGARKPDDPEPLGNFGQANAPPGLYRGITAGKAHSCAIELQSDEVHCWGGAGAAGDCFPPRSVQCGQANPPAGTFRQVSGGFTHSCGVTLGGELVCWGHGAQDDQCDPNSGGIDYECGQSASFAGTVEAVSTGDFHTCFIDEELKLRCQGWQVALGAGAPTGSFTQVSSGAEHSCGIRQNGTAACWGNNPSGETNIAGFPGE